MWARVGRHCANRQRPWQAGGALTGRGGSIENPISPNGRDSPRPAALAKASFKVQSRTTASVRAPRRQPRQHCLLVV